MWIKSQPSTYLKDDTKIIHKLLQNIKDCKMSHTMLHHHPSPTRLGLIVMGNLEGSHETLEKSKLMSIHSDQHFKLEDKILIKKERHLIS